MTNNIKIGDCFKLKYLFKDIWVPKDAVVKIIDIKKKFFIFNILTIKPIKYHPWTFIIHSNKTRTISERKLLKFYKYNDKITNENIIKDIIE